MYNSINGLCNGEGKKDLYEICKRKRTIKNKDNKNNEREGAGESQRSEKFTFGPNNFGFYYVITFWMGRGMSDGPWGGVLCRVLISTHTVLESGLAI